MKTYKTLNYFTKRFLRNDTLAVSILELMHSQKMRTKKSDQLKLCFFYVKDLFVLE